MPERMAAPTPMFCGCRTTSAPARLASAAVWSPEQSSTTSASACNAVGIFCSTRLILPCSLYAGMTTRVRSVMRSRPYATRSARAGEKTIRRCAAQRRTALAGHVQFANLGRRQPVDAQRADGAIAQADDAGQQVFERAVNVPFGFGVHTLDLCAADVAHDVQVVHGQVDHHTHVADAVGEGPLPVRVHLEDPPQLAA